MGKYVKVGAGKIACTCVEIIEFYYLFLYMETCTNFDNLMLSFLQFVATYVTTLASRRPQRSVREEAAPSPSKKQRNLL